MKSISEFQILNHSSFQDFVVDVFNAKNGSHTFHIWGRSGQKQHGIDIFSSKKKIIIQCKFKNEITSKCRAQLKSELKSEVEKALKSKIRFKQFILVSNYHHDAELQYQAIKLRDSEKYDFEINYIGWEELKKWALQFPKIVNLHFDKILLPPSVEFVSVTIDSVACSWEPVDGYENVFFDRESIISPFPVFDFTFVNHSNRLLVLKTIKLFVKKLYSGLSGLPSPPLLVESIHTYTMKFEYGKQSVLKVTPPIQVGPSQAFRFKLQVLNDAGLLANQIEGRNVLFFGFDFNLNISVCAPKIFLNTKNDSNKITLMYSD